MKYTVNNSDVTLLLPGKEYTRREVRKFTESAKSADTTKIQVSCKRLLLAM